MAVPKFHEFLPSVMKLLVKGDVYTVRQICEMAIADKNLSEEDRTQLLPSGIQRVADNRVQWAIQYLKKAQLIQAVKKGHYAITPAGLDAWQDVGEGINLNYLLRYESYLAFIGATTGNSQTSAAPSAPAYPDTPQDDFDTAYRKINDDLAERLMEAIMDQSPGFFERLVVSLLMKMGYGGAFDDAGVVVGHSGDEGIDGIIREDKLGFNSIYIQAKRWSPEKTIGRPDIQQFMGALAGQGASKGLFITTAGFSKEAKEYAAKHLSSKIVLIDGQRLTRLMIEYDVGVSTQTVYAIKRLDSDFFDEQNN